MKFIPVPKEQPRHLSQRQFFHVAPESARQDIEKHGIDYTRGERKWEQNQTGGGNFLWANQQSAYTYRNMANQLSQSDDVINWMDDSGQRYDVYEVNMPSVNRPKIEEDPEFAMGEAVKTTSPLPRRFVRRIG